MPEYPSITRLKDYLGKKVEIIAFGISYRGYLEEVDYDKGTLRMVEGDEFAILEIERVESFSLIDPIQDTQKP